MNEQRPYPYLGTPEHAETVAKDRHPGTRDGLMWLCFSHLPTDLQDHAQPFYQTAVEIILANVDSPELTKALNALTEAKDWAVRAGIRTQYGKAGPVARPAEVVDPPALAGNYGPGQPRPAYPSGVEPYSDAGHLTAREGWTRPVRDNPQA